MSKYADLLDAPLPQEASPSPTSTPVTQYSFGKSVGGPDESEDHWTNRGYSATGKNLTEGVAAVNTATYPLGSVFRDTNTGEVFIAADTHGNKDPLVVDIFRDPQNYRRNKENRSFQIVGKVDKVADTAQGIRDQLNQFRNQTPPTPAATEQPGKYADLLEYDQNTKPGKYADLLEYDQNPPKDIFDTLQPDAPVASDAWQRAGKRVMETAGTFLRGTAHMIDKLDQWLPSDQSGMFRLTKSASGNGDGQDVLTQGGNAVQQMANQIPTDKGQDNSLTSRVIDSGVPMAGFMATMAVNPAEAIIPVMGATGDLWKQDATKIVQAKGGKLTPEQADSIQSAGEAMGLISMLPFGNMIAALRGGNPVVANAVRTLSTGAAKAPVQEIITGSLGKTMAEGAAKAGVTGVIGSGVLTTGENVTLAQTGADPQRSPTEGLGISMGIGGVMGMLLGAHGAKQGFQSEQKAWENLTQAYASEMPNEQVQRAVAKYGEQRSPENLAKIITTANETFAGLTPEHQADVLTSLAAKLGIEIPPEQGAGKPKASTRSATDIFDEVSASMPADGETPPAATPAKGGAQDQFESQLATQEQVQRGAPTVVIGANGTEFPATWAFVPRSMIQPSHSGEMLAPNPAYPLANTRDYSGDSAEQDKAMATRNGWDPRRAIVDSPDAAVGPPMVARVIDANGTATLATAGGNNRQWAIQNLTPEKWQETQALQSQKAEQFGLQAPNDPEAQLVRFLGTFDFRKPGEQERLQGMVDALNPSPGMMQGAAKRAQIDVANVSPDKLAGVTMDISPAEAKTLVQQLVADGTLDRNRMAPILESAAHSQDYVQRLLVNAAFGQPSIAEARNDARQGNATLRGIIDAATPAMLAIRQQGPEGAAIADSAARALTTALDYLNHQGADKLPQALLHTAQQTELDPAYATAQALASQLHSALVLDKAGRVQSEPTIAAVQDIFARLQNAVSQYDPTPDIFGEQRTLGETVHAALGVDMEGSRDVFDTLHEMNAPSPGDQAPAGVVPNPSQVSNPERTQNISPEPGNVKPENTDQQDNYGTGLKVMSDKGDPYTDVVLAGLPDIKIIQMPELVGLARELMGSLPEIKRMGKARGVFLGIGNGRIKLDPRIFTNPQSAAKTLAHEIGHLVDYLPQQMLKRGNLWGRIHSLRGFMKDRWTSTGPTAKELRAELIELSNHWKPWTRDGSSYDQYRSSGVELYADFISVLFNSPATAKQFAPRFFREFFAALDTKPEVKRQFFELQTWLNRPAMQILTDRSQAVRQWFGKAEEIYERKMAERELRHAGYRGWTDRLKQAFFDQYHPIVSRAKGTPMQDAVKFFFDAHPLTDNRVYRWLERMHRTVIGPLEEQGLSMHDLGEALFFNRILNEHYEVSRKIAGEMEVETGGRSVIANPGGHTPETARMGLLRLRMEHGMKAMTILEAATQKFHDEVFALMQEAHKAGLFTDEQMALIEGNRDFYAAFVPLEYVDTFVTSGIRHQAGTFKEIADPFVSTVLKAVTLHRAIELQEAKQMTVQTLSSHFPGEISAAETVRAPGGMAMPRPPKERGMKQLMLKVGGKPAWYNVPAEIAAMFEHTDIPLLRGTLEVLDWPFRNIFYPLWISFNPLFQLIRNPIRDALRSFVNAPDQMLRTVLNGVRPEIAAFVKQGDISPLIADMLANFAITPPEQTFQESLVRKDTFGEILRQFDVLPPSEKPKLLESKIMAPLVKWGQWITNIGKMNELIPKAGAYKVLVNELGWDRADAAYYVRNYIGTPNYLKKGKYIWIPGTVFPFTNIWTKGWAADLELMRKGFKRSIDPEEPGKSPASWWFRWAATSGVWTVLKAAASLGLLGAAMKQLMDRVSSYDKTNYDIVPVGTLPSKDGQGKTAFIPIPKDPTDRILSGISYTMMMYLGKTLITGEPTTLGDTMAKNLSVGASDVPGLHPLLKIAGAWFTYLQGENPADSFRGQNILTNDQWLAGGWDSLQAMMGWTYKQTGAQSFVRYNPDADSTTEFVLGMIPAANGMLKVSNYGLREAQQAMEQQLDTDSAKFRLSLPTEVRKLLQERGYLSSLHGENRTVEQTMRLHSLNQWYSKAYKPTETRAAEVEQEGGNTKPAIQQLQNLSKPYVK
jgi:hypothetical protein